MTPSFHVLHFVSGGFSGATQVAIDLVRAARALPNGPTPVLVLRRKRQTPMARVQALRDEGLDVRLLPGWSRAATVWGLRALCRELAPQILVAHGFPEHLIGRVAGLWAGVPHLVQVEHNARERYRAWSLAQTRWLARHTDRIVGCSEGVRDVLLTQGLPQDRVIAIPNGVRLEPFARAAEHPYLQRQPALVMAARFAAQKDHATLLRALAVLRELGLRPQLLLAGGGRERHRREAVALCQSLGLQDQVQFLGFQSDMPSLLMRQQIAVLSSHYEGMPLFLVEGMAAGCAVVGSAVPGIKGMIRDGQDGRLVRAGDHHHLAEVLAELLSDPTTTARMAEAGRQRAWAEHSLALMGQRYNDLCQDLVHAR